MPLTSTPTLLAQQLHQSLSDSALCHVSREVLPAPLAGAVIRQVINSVLPEGTKLGRGYIQAKNGCSPLIEGLLVPQDTPEVGDICIAKPEEVLAIVVTLDTPVQTADFSTFVAQWGEMGGKAPVWGFATGPKQAGTAYLKAVGEHGKNQASKGIFVGQTGFIHATEEGWAYGEWKSDNQAESYPAYQVLLDQVVAAAKGESLATVVEAQAGFQSLESISQSSSTRNISLSQARQNSAGKGSNGQAGQAMAVAPAPTPPASKTSNQTVLKPEIFTPDEEGYYPLHRAVMAKKRAEVSSLLANGAITEVKDKDGCTPLHKAIQLGAEDITKLLLEKGANPNSRTYIASTALHMAVELRKPALTAQLIAYGAEIEARNNRGKTGLHIAASNGCLECAKVLVQKGANLAATMERDMQPLHLAAWYGQQALTEFLIHQGADINATNADGNAPLHFAAFNGQVKLIKVLINMRADMFLENQAGETYLQGINEGYQGEMIAVLS